MCKKYNKFIMETMKLFKKFEVIGKTKDEAIKQAAPMNLMVDATQAFKKWSKENATNEDNIKDWMKDYLKKKKYDKAGIGAYIVTQTGVQDTRERPYQVEKIKYEKRTHTPEKFYVGKAADTNEEIFCEKTSKAAEQASKEWVIDNQASVKIFVEHKVKEKNSLYAIVKYCPSKGTQPYKLTVFGYESAE